MEQLKALPILFPVQGYYQDQCWSSLPMDFIQPNFILPYATIHLCHPRLLFILRFCTLKCSYPALGFPYLSTLGYYFIGILFFPNRAFIPLFSAGKSCVAYDAFPLMRGAI